jgi:hypothetical protein
MIVQLWRLYANTCSNPNLKKNGSLATQMLEAVCIPSASVYIYQTQWTDLELAKRDAQEPPCHP